MESSSSSSTFSSSTSSSSADMHRYELFIGDGENKHADCKNESVQLIHPDSPARLFVYPTPQDTPEMRLLIARAELESDPRVVAIYDNALAPYCCDKNNLKGLLHDSIRFRFLCLNFPQSKTNLIGTLNAVTGTRDRNKLAIRPPVTDDQNSALSALLKETCTQYRLSTIKNKYNQRNGISLDQTSEEFAKELLDYKNSDNLPLFFSHYDAHTLFCYFLSLFDPLGDSGTPQKEVCDAVFNQLIQQDSWMHLPEEHIRDFTWLILHQPALLSQLQHDPHDRVYIRCKVKSTAECTLLTASRLLLCTQSMYFNGLVNNEEELDSSDLFDRYTLDLSETSFDSRTMELLLRWISHARTSMFAFDEHTQIKELESLIASVAAFGLVNQEEFEEAMVIELKKRLNMETICEITQIGMHYHLNLLIEFIVHFINSYKRGNLKLKEDEKGYYEVLQSQHGYDLPKQAYEALSILGPKIRAASIQTFRSNASRSKISKGSSVLRTVSKLLAVPRKFWNKCGGLIKRTTYFALSIFSIEKMADKEWMDERDYPLAVGLGLSYPLVKGIVKCSINCFRRRRGPAVVSLPGLLPLQCQIKTSMALLRVQESVYGCAHACFRRRGRPPATEPLIPHQNPIFNALPNTLQSLNLSQAADLNDDDCAKISSKFPRLSRLELGVHRDLRHFQFLAYLNLQEIHFTFRRGENGLSLEGLKLDQLLPNRDIKVTISLFDTTLVYAPPSFLHHLPDSASLHVSLHHAPIPPAFILFESPSGSGKAVAWPGVAAALSACFPFMSSLDCHGPLTDGDLEVISPRLATCHRLILRQGTLNFPPQGLTDAGIQTIANHAPQLEELFIGVSEITTVQSIVDRAIPLQKLALQSCIMLDNAALEPLATVPTLSTIHLEQIPNITDLCIHKLLESPSLQECIVLRCDGISNHMLAHLFQNKMSLKWDMEKTIHEIKQIFNIPLPKQLTKKLFLPIQFGLMHSLIQIEITEPRRRRGLEDKFYRFLGVVQEEHSRAFPFSLHEASAEFSLSLDALATEITQFSQRLKENSLLHAKEAEVPFHPFADKIKKLFLLYFLSQELAPYRHEIKSKYREFLAHYFSTEYLHEVDFLVTEFTHQCQNMVASNEAIKSHLQELPALMFLNPTEYISRLVELFHPQHPMVNKDVFINFASAIKTRAEALGWSSQQKLTPFFAAIIFNLNFFAQLLFPLAAEVGNSNLSAVSSGCEFDFDEKLNT